MDVIGIGCVVAGVLIGTLEIVGTFVFTTVVFPLVGTFNVLTMTFCNVFDVLVAIFICLVYTYTGN